MQCVTMYSIPKWREIISIKDIGGTTYKFEYGLWVG